MLRVIILIKGKNQIGLSFRTRVIEDHIYLPIVTMRYNLQVRFLYSF